jgi:hypothetical protein
MVLWTLMHKYESLLSVPLGIYLDLELLGHTVILVRNCQIAVAIQFYIHVPTCSSQRFQFLYNIAYTYFPFFKNSIIVMNVKWHLILVLICISLMI